MTEYSKEYLNSLGIYELRTVARQIGVSSPTILKKNEIIEKVLNIILGKEKPCTRTTRQGRPPKGISNLKDIANILHQNDTPYAERVNGKMSESSFKHNLSCVNDNIEFKGLFKLQEGIGCVIEFESQYYKERRIFVLEQTFKEYDLREGDLITGTLEFNKGEQIYVVQTLKSINGVFASKNIKRPRFYELNYEYPTKQVSLSQLDSKKDNLKVLDSLVPFTLGSRVVINFENRNCDVNCDIIRELDCLFKLSEQNCEISLLTIDDRPECIQEIKNKYEKINVVQKQIYQSSKTFLQSIILNFENLLRQVEMGKDVIAMFFDYENILNYLACAISLRDNLTMEQAITYARSKLIDVFSCAKATEGYGTLTVLMANCYDERILKLCNLYWHVNEEIYENTNVNLDINKSFIKNMDKKLSLKQINNIKKFKDSLKTKQISTCLEDLIKNK